MANDFKLIIDWAASEYAVWRDGSERHRAPIPARFKDVRRFYERIGYAVIEGRQRQGMIPTTDKTEQKMYEALLSIKTHGNTSRINGNTLRALNNRKYIDDNEAITSNGLDFMDDYENLLDVKAGQSSPSNGHPPAEQPTAQPDDDQPTAETILRQIRETSFKAVEEICRKTAPEALPHLQAIRLADSVLNLKDEK